MADATVAVAEDHEDTEMTSKMPDDLTSRESKRIHSESSSHEQLSPGAKRKPPGFNEEELMLKIAIMRKEIDGLKWGREQCVETMDIMTKRLQLAEDDQKNGYLELCGQVTQVRIETESLRADQEEMRENFRRLNLEVDAEISSTINRLKKIEEQMRLAAAAVVNPLKLA